MNSYGIVVYGKGPASGGFSLELEDPEESSADIIIRRNRIHNIKCISKEVPAAVENDEIVHDVRGAVFQFFDTYANTGLAMKLTDATYRGNVLADAQIMTAAAIHEGLFDNDSDPYYLTHLNTITPNIVTWAKGVPTTTGSRTVPPIYIPKYRCHGDAMHHVTIGMVGIRLEET